MKLLIQLADGFCDKGHSHAVEIKNWVTAVDKRYRDFSLRMEKYRVALEKALGILDSKAVSKCCQYLFLFSLYFSYMFIEMFLLNHPMQSKDLQLDIIPSSAPGSEVKLRDAAHELNEERRKSARRKEYVLISFKLSLSLPI